MDWFTSDPHFGHDRILDFENKYRPYADVDEMNKAIVDNINSKVTDKDTLYILGDIAFRSQYQYLDYLNAAKIVIVLGNHDYPNKIGSIMKPGIKVAGCLEYKGCILTHIPVHPGQKARFMANLHGHLHGAFIEDPFYYNVGLERHNMMPISWNELEVNLYKQNNCP